MYDKHLLTVFGLIFNFGYNTVNVAEMNDSIYKKKFRFLS